MRINLNQIPQNQLAGWHDDARRAIVENPDYFVWWYTLKSVGLAAVAALAAYYIGKDVSRRTR